LFELCCLKALGLKAQKKVAFTEWDSMENSEANPSDSTTFIIVKSKKSSQLGAFLLSEIEKLCNVYI
jgi:hypothetical protein